MSRWVESLYEKPIACFRRLSHPIVGIASTPSGRGYWLVAHDGGMFTFGDAEFHGSAVRRHLRRPIVAMTATPSGHRHRLVSDDGRVFSHSDATVGLHARASSFRALRFRASDFRACDFRASEIGNASIAGTRAEAAISLGNGQVVSTSIYHRIAVAPTGFLQRPLGWSLQPW